MPKTIGYRSKPLPKHLKKLLWQRDYDRYMHSTAWLRKREAVLHRANGRCERHYCTAAATQVHHLTYRNLGNEPLEELQALCRRCHDLLHRDKALLYQRPIQTPEERLASQEARALASAQYHAYRERLLNSFSCPNCQYTRPTKLHGVLRCTRCGTPMIPRTTKRIPKS